MVTAGAAGALPQQPPGAAGAYASAGSPTNPPIVDCERRGTWVYYWPRPENLRRLSVLLDTPGLTASPASARAGDGNPSVT